MKEHVMTQGERSALCMELSLLFHAGVGAGDALALMAQESDPDTAALLAAMAQEVDDGATLSAALRSAGVFPAYLWGLVEVGERSGRTEEALMALSRYYDERERMDRRVRSALLYPAVMLVLMLAVIAVLLVRVLPIFDEVYASLGGRLTGVAGGLLALGRWLDALMPSMLILLALAVLLLVCFAVAPSFRGSVVAWWRKMWGDKGLSRQMNNAHVVQALAMGTRSGLTPEEALDLAAGLVEDVPAARTRCLDCRTRLDGGESLSAALKGCGLLTTAQGRLLELSRRSGGGDEALAHISDSLSEESEAALEEKLGRVEPALVLVCSVLVGLILLSVMLPLMHIMTAIG